MSEYRFVHFVCKNLSLCVKMLSTEAGPGVIAAGCLQATYFA